MRKLKQIGGKVEVIELELETVADLPHYRADRALLDYIERDINMSRSLIIQNGFDARLKIDLNIVESFVKKTFDYFNIEIKNISFSYGRTTKYLKYTQKNTEKFHQAYLGDNFDSVCFYSQNTADFEPNSLLVVYLTYFNGLGKINCIVDSSLISDEINNCNDIFKSIKENFPVSSCCAFGVPKCYYPLSFSYGILRRLDMPCEYKNIAGWIAKYSTNLNIIGNYNYIKTDNEEISDSVTALLDSNEYKKEDGGLYFWIDTSSDIGELIFSEKYEILERVLCKYNLLNKNEYWKSR